MPGRIDLRAEHGATLIVVAAMLPLLVVFGSFALNISNWFVHKRHLQVQADAAALAGASAFQVDGCDNASILRAAQQYSGSRPADYNRQSASVAFSANAAPCADKALDVTMTETDLPWFMRAANMIKVGNDIRVRTNARVQLQQLASSDGMLPLAVVDDQVTHVRAFIVDEDGDRDTPIAPGAGEVTSEELTVAGTGAGVETWSTGAPLKLNSVTQRNLGVRIAVSYGNGSGCPSSADVTCYSTDSGDVGLIHIHSFPRPPADVTTGAPALHSAELVTCPPSPSPSFTTTDCQLTVRAIVDWNDKVDGAIADETAKANPDCSSIARIRARLGGGGWADLECVPSAPGQPSTFEGRFNVPGDAGALPLQMTYVQYQGKDGTGRACGDGQGSGPGPCWGAFDGNRARGLELPGETAAELAAAVTKVNRVYSGGPTRTDAISAATVSFAAGPRAGYPANAVERCASGPSCAQAFNVTVDLPGPLQVGDQRDLTVKASGANDQLLDCEPDANGAASVENMIATGCPQRFAVNPAGQACPGFSAFGPGMPQPWTCVPTFKGNPARVTRGMTRRVFFGGGALGSVDAATCAAHPDRWPDWQQDPSDPRIVGVLLAGRGTFDINSNHVMPVHDFAYFYVRGWGGDPCALGAGNGGDDPFVPDGVIRGSFIKYVRRNDGGATGTGGICRDSSLGGCVPVMTR